MRKILLGLIVLLPSLAGAAAIRSQQTGDWGTGATWVGGVSPGNGDTVTIYHTVTVSDSRIVGTSPSSGTVVCNLSSTGTIHIVSGGYLRMRGDVTYTADTANTTDAVNIDGGGIWEFDSSQASGPTFQKYAFYPNNNFGWRAFKAVGSAGSRAILRTNSSSGMGALRMNGWAYGGGYTLTYSSVTNMSFEFYYRDDNGSADPTVWNVTHTSFTSCGLIAEVGGGLHPDAAFHHDNNEHVSTVGGQIFDMRVGVFISSNGVRSIQNNVFDTQLATNGGFKDFTIAGNYFADGFSVFYSSSFWNSNFVRMSTVEINLAGAAGWNYFHVDQDLTNPHVVNFFGTFNTSVSSSVFGQSGKANGLGGDDSGEWVLPSNPTAFTTYTLTSNIFLPNGNGFSSAEVTSLLGSGADSNTWLKYIFSVNHNTWFGGWAVGNQFAMMDYSETVNMSPGRMVLFTNNLMWNPEIKSAGFLKTLDIGNVGSNLAAGFGTGPTQNVCSPTNCDYNGSFNVNATAAGGNVAAFTNQGKGYGGKYSATPGTHDVDGQDPTFVAYHRNMEEFDAGYYRPYLSQAAATAWSNGGSYAIGDVVAHSSSTFYWGDTINYRYTNGAGCSSANPEPGAGLLSTWENCWEFASLYDVRQSIATGATFTDATIGATSSDVTTTMILWIRAGYAPSNSAFAAANDGGTMGAVPLYVAPSTVKGFGGSGTLHGTFR